MKTIVFVVLCLFASIANAADIKIIWHAPATRVQGQTIARSEIKGFRVYCSATQGGPYTLIATVSGKVDTITTQSCVTNGFGYFRVTAVDQDNVESSYSNEMKKQFSAGAPLQPELPACENTFYVTKGFAQNQQMLKLTDPSKPISETNNITGMFSQDGIPIVVDNGKMCEMENPVVSLPEQNLMYVTNYDGVRGLAWCKKW